MASLLPSILDKLLSDKIKERSLGVSQFSELISSSRSLASLTSSSHDRPSWLEILQTIFNLVVTERNINVGKPSAVSAKRVEEATTLLRALVEKVHLGFNKKTIKALINHLLQTVAIGGKLQSLVVTYIRTLRFLLSHSPHLHHLEERQWVDLTTLCFNGVLGDKIVIGQDFNDEIAMEIDGEPSSSDSETDGRGPLRDDLADLSSTFSGYDAATKRTATASDIELISLLEVLFRSKYAPFPYYASIILTKFSRFFALFPTETSAHLPALVSLNSALREIELNRLKGMKKFGVAKGGLWGKLITYWGTKNAALKEQLVIALTYFFPFVTPLSSSSLLSQILDSSRFPDLSLDTLRLSLQSESEGKKEPFRNRTFGIGRAFNEKNALAWCMLELGADCLRETWKRADGWRAEGEDDSDSASASEKRKGKRRKIEDPATAFLSSLPSDPAPLQTFKLQLLLFLISRHWSSLHFDLASSIHKTTINLLLSNDDSDVQNWCLMICGAVVIEQWPEETIFGGAAEGGGRKRTTTQTTLQSTYEQLFQIAIRKLSNPHLSRLSSHLFNLLLSFSRIESTSLINEAVESVTRELEIQGPNFPSETVCELLGWCVALAGRDLRLSKGRVEEKVFGWLTTGWKPLDGVVRLHSFGSVRPRSDPFFPGDLVTLISRTCGLDKIPSIPFEVIYPDCPVATMALEMAETFPVREYLRGRTPKYSVDNPTPRVDSITALLGVDVRRQEGLDRRISSWLERSLNELIATGKDLGETYWSTMTEDMLRRHLDFAVLAILVEGTLEVNKAISRIPTVKSAVDLIDFILPSLVIKKWSPSERAVLIGGLTPLFIASPPDPTSDYPVFLDPGIASVLPKHLLPDRPAQTTAVDFSSLEITVLKTIWSQPPVKSLFTRLSTILLDIIGVESRDPPEPTPMSQGASQSQRVKKDDDFGDIKVGKSSLLGKGPSAERAEAACIAGSVRGLIAASMVASGSNTVARVQEIVDAIVESEGNEAVVLVEQTCNAVTAGLINLGVGGACSILDHIGGVLLPSYTYARDERFHIATLRFLECTSSIWVKATDAAVDYGGQARQLCAFYVGQLQNKILYSWKARLRLMALCDTYLTIDRTQEHWNDGNLAHKNAEGDDLPPTAIIPSMIADIDFRVRFRAATSSSRQFTFIAENEVEDGDGVLFRDIKSNLPQDMSDEDTLLTSNLVYANMAIASGSRRRPPLSKLFWNAHKVPPARVQIHACFDGIAQRIGLGTASKLYEWFVASTALGTYVTSDGDPSDSQIPYDACGYSSFQEMRQHDILLMGPILNGYGRFNSFAKACSILHRPAKDIALECLPGSLAFALLHASRQDAPTVDSDQRKMAVREQLQWIGCKDDHQGDVIVKSISDEIMVALLTTLHEPQGREGLLAAVQADARVSKMFRLLMSTCPAIESYRGSTPALPATLVVKTCSWLHKHYSIFENTASVYSVVVQLLTAVHRAHFVPEQHYGLVRVALALSLSYRQANNPNILGALADSLVILLLQIDLAPFAAGILEWAFTEWLKVVEVRPASRTALRKALAQAQLALNSSDDELLAGAFQQKQQFGVFLGQCIRQSCKLEGTTTAELLLLSPGDILEGEASKADIDAALTSSFGHAAKFAMVRVVEQNANLVDGRIVWRLMDCLPSSELASAADSTTLADLLYETEGDVLPPGLEAAPSTFAKQDLTDNGGDIDEKLTLRSSIVGQLLANLQRDGSGDMATVSDTLRNLLAVDRTQSDKMLSLLPAKLLSLAKVFAAPHLQRPFRVRTSTATTLEELKSPLWMDRARSFDEWARHLGRLLSDFIGEEDRFYAQLPPLLDRSATIATQLLPSLVRAVLLEEAEDPEELSRDVLSEYFSQLLSNPATHIDCIRCIIDIVVNLRRHRKPCVGLPSESFDTWLKISWILLSGAAARTGAHLTSLLFLELGHEYDGLFTSSAMDTLDQRGQAVLYEIYEHIEEPDGFYGRQSSNIREALVRQYRHEERWNEAFCVYGADFEGNHDQQHRSAAMEVTGGLTQSLASFGFNRLAQLILQSARNNGEIPDDALSPGLVYDLGWRTDNWDLPTERRAEQTSSAACYSALRAIRANRDDTSLQAIVMENLQRETAKLATVTLDQPTPRTSVVAAVLSLREIVHWISHGLSQELSPILSTSLCKISSTMRFEYAERILATRISLLRAVRSKDQFGDDFASPISLEAARLEQLCMLELSVAARRAGHLQASMNAITLAKKLVAAGETSHLVHEEFANILWAQGEHGTAITLLTTLRPPSGGQKAVVLSRLGNWTAEARLKNPREIVETFFEPALASLDDTSLGGDCGKVYSTFAAFADIQYEDLVRQVSEKKTRFTMYKKRKEAELTEVDRLLKGSQQDSIRRSQLLKEQRNGKSQLEEDQQRLSEAEATTRLMLMKALENYAHALESSDEHDDKVYRFCALWLAHADDDELHTTLADLLSKIPSYKFVFLAYQLSARLSKHKTPPPFARNITKLIIRLGSDHPFHALFPVNTLRGYSDAPENGIGGRSRRSSTQELATVSQGSRAQAADEVFEKVKRIKRLQERVLALEIACDAYREWALWDVRSNAEYSVNKKFKGGVQIIKRESKLRRQVNDLAIPVSTYNLPIDKSCLYPVESFPHIMKYLDTFEIPGGITLPKKVTCVGSNGVHYLQLMKGNDPCRQDAVMEQTFELVNTLLAADAETRRRRLHIRKYKVIPLQSESGLLEFVIHTKSLSDCILPLYRSFRLPNALSVDEVRRKIKDAQGPTSGDVNSLRQKRITVFKNALAKFPPVMRHLFFQHKIPSLWFDMRLNYSRSVATTSIVGHIMGLGDRHVSNILMDESRGDLLQIDFGIAFDQGKRLPIPETVPFRLTQNVVDGFGMTGVDGVFRRSAEQTLRVLRERSSVLMTVLQVFKHDPLQTWALTAELAKSIQGFDSDGAAVGLEDQPDEADRALSIISDKLSKHLSVEYTVNQLIQEATNPANLAVIFSGWQAYL